MYTSTKALCVLALILAAAIAPPTRAQSVSGPLQTKAPNTRYFCDKNGRAVFLTGSHAWLNFQDGGFTYPPPVFEFDRYLDTLSAYDHNFIRLWTWEQAKWIQEYHGDYFFDPLPYQRTGPGTALDGRPKFDLTKFNQAYFDRLRSRVAAAGSRGMYVSVMMFEGWSVANYALAASEDNTPFNGHPFNKHNNINGIDGDTNGDTWGLEVHTLSIPAVTAIQEAYVRKVIETVNDLDNVLYEISDESAEGSTLWQYHMIAFIKQCEAGMAKQHPVGMTAQWPTQTTNANLFASAADWISPNNVDYSDNLPAADGSKVIILDSDHVFGVGGLPDWFWKAMTRGMNPIYMDVYDRTYPVGPGGSAPDTILTQIRRCMGVMRAYARQMNFNAMVPHSECSSTTYCLANTAATAGQYLVYSQWGGTVSVDLSGAAGTLVCEWYFPRTHTRSSAGTVQGGAVRTFTSPGGQDAVLSIMAESTLPVELTGFSAKTQGDAVILSWATATEVNNYGFEIERTVPDGRPWTTVGFVPGMGTSSTSHAYTFRDAPPGNSVSYRLKQVDRDGKFSYSGEIALALATAPSVCELFQNYPNPFNPSTNIQYSVGSDTHVRLAVTDMLGRETAVLVDGMKTPGRYAVRWDARAVPSGMYFYTLRAGTYTAAYKMLFQK